MPRNVRNFWIEIDIDGARKRVSCGPVAKDGEFRLLIKIRENGEISNETIGINGRVMGNRLLIIAEDFKGNSAVLIEKQR